MAECREPELRSQALQSAPRQLVLHCPELFMMHATISACSVEGAEQLAHAKSKQPASCSSILLMPALADM